MKHKSVHILLQLYIWGMLLIPALHHAGVICPHLPADGSSITSGHTVSYRQKQDTPFAHYADDVCLICLTASVMMDVPAKTPDVVIVGDWYSSDSDLYVDKTFTSRWLLCEYRGPPSVC